MMVYLWIRPSVKGVVMRFQSIDIDFDIHKRIEAERRSFDEPAYLALRRLLNLPSPDMDTQAVDVEDAGVGAPFVEDGVQIPHGSLARMKYQRGRQLYSGRFLNGQLVVNDQSFTSLSAAANACAVTKTGGKTQLNGWRYWEAKLPGESRWRSLDDMRSKTA